MLSTLHDLAKNNNERIILDEYFMSIARITSQCSLCSKLNLGYVIDKNNRLISMGYNDYIPGTPHISRLQDNYEQSIIHS
jgi:dCMP deaminase